MALVELAKYYNSFEAGLARSVLAEHSINAALFDFNVGAEGGFVGTLIRLMVDEDDVERARRILAEEAEGEAEAEDEDEG